MRSSSSGSSDPKPREGTETLRRRIRDLFPRIGRQTQNPERGRKLPRRLAITTPTNGRQTQNPERGRKPAKYRLHDTTTTRRQTQNPERGRKLLTMRLPRALFQPSSDPKPREGTETGSRQTGSRRSSPVVRPKTPRGDGNPTMASKSAWVTDPGRQTQNPERGRKRPVDGGCVVRARVVRPKTPRGDGNAYRPPHHSHATAPCPQTQNPERGRKHTADDSYVRVTSSQSSDPKPREGTET
ncbi:Uncharacterised protein [Mycobacterium tuberculosis]|nr:Uncharacterised protein [Mycobacterium tuberculosis]